MSKPFAVFDIDGTIFRSSLLIEVVNALIVRGIFANRTAADMQQALRNWEDRASQDAYNLYLKQVIDFFVANIKGVTENQLNLVADAVIEATAKHTYVYPRELINKLSKTHALLAISGSPKPLVERFAKAYGFTDFTGTDYLTIDGVYSGEHTPASDNKDIILDKLVKAHGLSYKGSVAIGDTSGDIELLSAVEQPIAFNPDAKLRQHATQNGWDIVIERKSQIYELHSKGKHYELG